MDKREEVERESELKSGLNYLETDANNLRAQVKELRGKLAPVMREIPVKPTEEQVVKQPYSPTGQQIGVITGTVNEIEIIVDEIMQYLEV